MQDHIEGDRPMDDMERTVRKSGSRRPIGSFRSDSIATNPNRVAFGSIRPIDRRNWYTGPPEHPGMPDSLLDSDSAQYARFSVPRMSAWREPGSSSRRTTA